MNFIKTNEWNIFVNHKKMLEHTDDDSLEINPSERSEESKTMRLYQCLSLVSKISAKSLEIVHKELYIKVSNVELRSQMYQKTSKAAIYF